MEPATAPDGRPVIFGEVLFDTFPDGTAVLGGAPFNVAWHLQGFGVPPLLISRVGTDERGRRVLETMEAWGLDTAGVQRDPAYPTGTVRIAMDDRGGHSFEILPDQAYDFVEPRAARAAAPARPVPILYMGTLAARRPESRATLDGLIHSLDAPVFVDVNLRDPWWRHERVDQGLRSARWARLNDEELAAISEEPVTSDNLLDAAARLRASHHLQLLVLTLGADGACFVTADQTLRSPAPPLGEVADTVGAGDGFAAVTILGLLKAWPLERTLDRALQFAAAICRQRGATARDLDLYKRFLDQWAA